MKTKVLRGDIAKTVLSRVAKKQPLEKKKRPEAEKRKAMYGDKND